MDRDGKEDREEKNRRKCKTGGHALRGRPVTGGWRGREWEIGKTRTGRMTGDKKMDRKGKDDREEKKNEGMEDRGPCTDRKAGDRWRGRNGRQKGKEGSGGKWKVRKGKKKEDREERE